MLSATVFDIHVEREMGQRDLRLRKVIERFCLGCGVGVLMSMMITRWSEMVRLVCESCWIWRPVEQTRPRMCPQLWVEKLLSEVETFEYVKKVCCTFAVRGVDVNVKVTKEKNGW